jgi:hypothetical protein
MLNPKELDTVLLALHRCSQCCFPKSRYFPRQENKLKQEIISYISLQPSAR